ncbi:MAG: ribonuclease HII [Rhizobiales bacterium]|nr:ribonuclease HII [Hyphomicrobiales bacterium]
MKPRQPRLAASLAEIVAELAGSSRPVEVSGHQALEAIAARKPAPAIVGIDEAGRGPLAGPVVAAAVRLGARTDCTGIDDSKRLSPAARERLSLAIRESASVGIAIVDVATIDRVNILEATMLAMEGALTDLLDGPTARARNPHSLRAPPIPTLVLVDGNRLPPGLARRVECALPVVDGDARMAAIAAASIIAKTVRDALMTDLARRHPGYGWESNMGYGTSAHLEALARLGPTPHHRRSFAPVRRLCAPSAAPWNRHD